jgi:hypothetical protein
MSSWHYGIGAAAVGWIALTPAAAAQSGTGHQDAPSGDVWITPDKPSSIPRHLIGQTTPNNSEIPTGDVWPAPDGVTRTAQPEAKPQQETRRTGQ